MADGLKIVVDAEVKPAEAAIDRLGDTIRNRLGGAPGQSFGKGIEEGIVKPLGKIPNASNAATLSMINLGRVVQDAPFGFLGIANNLNPLLESFQRLKTTTGSTGGALKALGSSLMGAGGLGLAVSLLSTGLILFGDKLFGIGKAAKAAKEAIATLATDFSKQASQLTVLVGIVQNVNSKYIDKKNALAEINKEYGPYIKSLGIEEVTAGNIALAYDKITDALLRQAVVKGLQEQISKAVEETAKKLLTLQIAEENRRLESEKIIKSEAKKTTAIEDAQKGLQRYNTTVNDGFIAQTRTNKANTEAFQKVNTYESALERLKAQLMETLKPLLNLTTSFADLGIKTPKVKIDKVKVKPVRVELDFGELKLIELPESEQSKLDKIFEAHFKKLGGLVDLSLPKISIAVGASFEGISKGFAEQTAAAQKLADTITGIVAPAFQGLFEAFVSGQSPIKAFFSALGQALQSLVSQLIQAAIKALVLKLILSAAGGGGAASGIGGLFGSLAGGINSRGGIPGVGGGLAGRSSVVVQGSFRLRGADAILQLNRENRRQQTG